MKISCGTDIIEIERIKKAIESNTDKFLQTIFTEKEIEYCESKKMQKYQSYAARFAAKEAAFKAVNDRVQDESKYNWKAFEVQKAEDGKPIMNITCNVEGLQSVDISISHCKQYAVANVVVISK